MSEAEFVLDLRGEVCPIPVLKTQAKLSEMVEGQLIEVIIDYPSAKENICLMARGNGFNVEREEVDGKTIRVLIRK